MDLFRIHIPRPCTQNQDALTPTQAGWHCAACQTEVIDFTRLTEAEVVAYLAERRGQRVCAAVRSPVVPQPYQRPRGPRRWLLAVAAFWGWQSAAALTPQLPPGWPSLFKTATRQARVTIRGVVLDDSLHVPIGGAQVFIEGTKYGAVTNEKGEFFFSFASDWHLAAKGEFSLEVSAGHFTFERRLVVVNFKNSLAPPPLTVRLASLPGRWHTKGKIRITPLPVPPPDSGKS